VCHVYVCSRNAEEKTLIRNLNKELFILEARKHVYGEGVAKLPRKKSTTRSIKSIILDFSIS